MWWLTGIGRIASSLQKWQTKVLDAKTEQERIQAQAVVDKLTNQMKAQTSGQATWTPKLVRAVSFTPFVIFLWKVILWDKILNLGTTDNLSPQLWNVFFVMLGYYFLTDLKNWFGRK